MDHAQKHSDLDNFLKVNHSSKKCCLFAFSQISARCRISKNIRYLLSRDFSFGSVKANNENYLFSGTAFLTPK